MSQFIEIVAIIVIVGAVFVCCAMAMGVMKLIGAVANSIIQSMSEKEKKHGSKHGFLHMHSTTQYERHASVKSRLANGLQNAPEIELDLNLESKDPAQKPVAVLKFEGDVMASGRTSMAKLVDEIIANKDRFGEAVVVVNSPGGGVAHYGQCYAEMERIRNAEIPLTVCVDTYAASGGCLMSLPANRIVAAPFAMVGSIGVVAEFVNIHKFLKAIGCTPMTLTAGKYKRTLTPTSDPDNEEAKKHFEEQLVSVHEQFKAAVHKYRPEVDIEAVCTGDHWTAQESMEKKLGLVDALGTSQEVLFAINQDRDLIFLSERKNAFSKGLLRFLVDLSEQVIVRLYHRFNSGMN